MFSTVQRVEESTPQTKLCQNKFHTSDKMTTGNMKDKLCRFQNSGYCKYKDKCIFKHVTEECDDRKCNRKTCQKRHIKLCRYGNGCRRQLTCEYKHKANSEEAGLKSKIKELEETIKNLVEENKTYLAKLSALDIEIQTYQEEVIRENEEKKTVIKTLREKVRKEEKVMNS